MKYKTLFRVLLKILGLYFTVQGLCFLFAQSAYIIQILTLPFRSEFSRVQLTYQIAVYFACHIFEFAVGLYFFFGGKWIVNKAIPGNRPYCHECGYDLTQNSSGLCPECGTPTPDPAGTKPGTPALPPAERPQA
jgi:hypothetical protein